ncbi:MAG: hypothetical protein IT434_15790 [Phycisphaerales bacterium]|nr:hypothetical protein [Phycisphaerales bacterium]
MADANPPSFEEWLHYCLTRESRNPDESEEKRIARFELIEPSALAALMHRLFASPGFLVDRCSPDQIGGLVDFLFSMDSGYMTRVFLARDVPASTQAALLTELSTFYIELLDRVCGRQGSDPDSDLRFTDHVDGKVYMMWDMNGLECVAVRSENPHLIEPGMRVLEAALFRCRTSACRISALHGIGHLYSMNSESQPSIARQLQSLVDRFVASTPLPDWLAEYAACARDGYVE